MSAPKKAVREIYMDEEKRNGKRSHGAVMALIFMLTIFTWGQVLLFSRPTPKEPAVTPAAFPDIPAVVEKCMPSSVIFQVRKTVLSDPSDSDSEKMQVTEAASGIIWEEREDKLLIVTNNHVVEGADSIRVRFSPEKAQGILLTAETLGRDQTADIAVVSIEKSQIPEEILPLVYPAVRGDATSVRVGQWAILIGNALGEGQNVSFGIVSAVNRYLNNGAFQQEVFTSDAAINNGNSGGMLLNQDGEVIGVTSSKSEKLGSEGMGYYVPIDTVTKTVAELLSQAGR